jgi:hypothetical protein
MVTEFLLGKLNSCISCGCSPFTFSCDVAFLPSFLLPSLVPYVHVAHVTLSILYSARNLRSLGLFWVISSRDVKSWNRSRIVAATREYSAHPRPVLDAPSSRDRELRRAWIPDHSMVSESDPDS